MSIRIRIILVVLLALSGAGIAAYWFHAAGLLRKGIDDFAAARRAEGWTVELSEPAMSGFPTRVNARLDSVTLRSPLGLAWSAEQLSVSVPLTSPLEPVVEAPGFHRLAGFGWSGVVSAKTLTARPRLTLEGQLAALAVTGSALALEQAGYDPLILDRVELGLDWPRPADHSHHAAFLTLRLELDGLGLPDLTGLPFDRRVAAIRLNARMMGTPPDGGFATALAAWSGEGGTVEIDRALVEWAPLGLEADGTFALDPGLQPLLSASARVRGGGDLVTRLVAAGVIEPGAAEAARFMLALMARPDPQGRPTLNMPLTLQDGVLTAGQFPLLRLPPLLPLPGVPTP
ncbi:hypothetical protein A6A04_04195 [Paramagnetospirillum marisnigri]|uniref:DUF2125 domain-containing protein n=1 Tax=Paramagnetospirillum marisnigri TaxID=1285242 RepID=A0A178MIL1_9PROT|nr:DUF2125 domain-containing protein [Paramagnetospirillum marisnigri]OAN47968.1 hypothetical protein A6A04_04195 [Paramagnetospirillum marisnigri]